ncbi:MAG: cyclase family protein [Pseudomonadales bacterium]|jgi:kynurenine formamidase
MTELAEVTADYCERLWERVCNWGRWGDDDQAGTLNLITPEKRRKAAALAVDGDVIGLGNLWPVDPAPDNMWPAQHRMVRGGDAGPYPGVPGLNVALDYIGVECHGVATSHVDALCHVFVGGRMYNGYAAADVKSTGAEKNDIMPMADGVVSRGVLLDVPRLTGRDFLPGDYRISVADLEAAEAAQNVRVEDGDVLIVHLGREARTRSEGVFNSAEGLAGLHPECVGWFHDRGVAMLGSDGMNDPQPNWPGADGWPIPVHYLGICGMGMTLMHNLETDRLARRLAERGNGAFLFALAPLKIPGATGSPANPLAFL